MKNNESKIRIDATSNAYLVNRYLAYCTEQIYNTSGSVEENVPIKTKSYYKVQWQNIISDLRGLFTKPVITIPRVAYSLLAFYYILQHRHLDAHLTAFFVGSIAYDDSGQTSHTGEPATISWNITIGSGSDRIVTLMVSGLDLANAPTFDSNATTAINSVGALRTAYYINPSTGTATCAATGGNIKTGGAVSFTGVDQTSPIGADTTDDNSTDEIDLTTTEDGSVRIDVRGAYRDDATNPTTTLDSGTVRVNAITPQNQFRIGLFVYTNDVASAGLTTRTWSDTSFWQHSSAFEIIASTGGGGGTALQDPIQAGIVPFAR